MKPLLKMESKRAFGSLWFRISLLMGVALVLWHYMQMRSYGIEQLELYDTYHKHLDVPVSAFTLSLGMDWSIQHVLFYMLFPIFAALPFTDSFCVDEKTGLLKNILLRCKKRQFYMARYIVTFATGACAVALPIVLDLLLATATYPALTLRPSMGTSPIFAFKMWSEIFYQSPLLYWFLYLLIDMVFGGLLATVGLAVSIVVENRFIVLLSPFLLYFIVLSICNFLSASWPAAEMFNLQNFLNMEQPGTVQIWVVALIGALLTAFTAGTFIGRRPNEDVY